MPIKFDEHNLGGQARYLYETLHTSKSGLAFFRGLEAVEAGAWLLACRCCRQLNDVPRTIRLYWHRSGMASGTHGQSSPVLSFSGVCHDSVMILD